MKYNTQRTKLVMPEFGRHVQKMIEYVMSIPDKEKRNEQIQSVIQIMGFLNPSLRDLEDYRHKLWDNVHIISDFKLDIDSPYPTPTIETFQTRPKVIELDKTPLKAAHYGRNIQNMIEMISEKEEGESRDNMIIVLAHYMRDQYLIWNKESVTQETIFKDIERLSSGRLRVPEGAQLSTQSHTPQSHQGGGREFHRQPHRGGGRRRTTKRK